jgi:muramoyltetrapeptide carboxypeptidase LdcA involved in peptidoglycan recycling
MSIRYPKPLASGDLIAVTAPSCGVPPLLYRRLDRAIDALRQHGYRVIEGKSLRQPKNPFNFPRDLRAAELMRFLMDADVAAVIPPWGGERAIELLPLIDFAALSAAPPKWFVGFSDLSTLHLPLTLISGWATLHGPNLMELGAPNPDAVTTAVWDILTAPSGSQVSQVSSKMFQGEGSDWGVQPEADLKLTAETRWKRLDGSGGALQLSGRIIGGCLDTIARLAGSRYGEVPRFIRESGQDGALLYLEHVEMSPSELLRALHSLRFCGWFEGLNGILIGRAPGAEPSAGLSYVEAMRSAFSGLACPVLYDLDIGHVPPQLSIVNGAWASIDFEDGQGTVVQRLL